MWECSYACLPAERCDTTESGKKGKSKLKYIHIHTLAHTLAHITQYTCTHATTQREQEPTEKLKALLVQTIRGGQNNAALLMGKRGCGKSLVLRRVCRQIRQELSPEGIDFVTIHLNGHLQTDDTASLREVCGCGHVWMCTCMDVWMYVCSGNLYLP